MCVCAVHGYSTCRGLKRTSGMRLQLQRAVSHHAGAETEPMSSAIAASALLTTEPSFHHPINIFEKRSISLATRKSQIRTTLRFSAQTEWLPSRKQMPAIAGQTVRICQCTLPISFRLLAFKDEQISSTEASHRESLFITPNNGAKWIETSKPMSPN